MVKNGNDFLGLLIENVNSENEINQDTFMKLTELNFGTYRQYLVSLKHKGYVYSDISVVSPNELGRRKYLSNSQKVKKKLFYFSKLSLKFFVGIFSGIIIAIVSALVIWYFGPN